MSRVGSIPSPRGTPSTWRRGGGRPALAVYCCRRFCVCLLFGLFAFSREKEVCNYFVQSTRVCVSVNIRKRFYTSGHVCLSEAIAMRAGDVGVTGKAPSGVAPAAVLSFFSGTRTRSLARGRRGWGWGRGGSSSIRQEAEAGRGLGLAVTTEPAACGSEVGVPLLKATPQGTQAVPLPRGVFRSPFLLQ